MEDVINKSDIAAKATAKADVLLEALPYIQNFYDKAVVIKYGGAAMTDATIRRNLLEDIVFMSYVGMRPILVHGGGPALSERIKSTGKESKFVQGFRVTDEETMHLAEEEFIKINRDIVRELNSLGGSALTLSGMDDHLIEVQKHPDIDGKDIGYVGDVVTSFPSSHRSVSGLKGIPTTSTPIRWLQKWRVLSTRSNSLSLRMYAVSSERWTMRARSCHTRISRR